ncbi:Phenylacetic acid catabolic protein [Aliiroseovarius marinus]|uniref:Phenylacetic acid catabolic protein n=1 Tax=Aliiroseovarius marinus TaxID=2500159 RepID=UPI003D7CB2E0
MSDMSITDYLAQGGVLSNPENVPARYRAELMRLMATFVDSALAGAAGFADIINDGPGIKERIAAAKIVLEKTDNADKVLSIMGDFGANTARYANHHPWTDRVARDADIGTSRTDTDMRLSVFNYPMQGWSDAVVMNLLMGLAVGVQLSEFKRVSYAPLAEAFRAITPVEARHAELAAEGIERLTQTGTDTSDLQASVTYWWPRVAASFGKDVSTRASQLQAFGLRHSSNAELRDEWEATAAKTLKKLGLSAP